MKKLTLTFFVLLFCLSLWAQDTKITTGVVHFNSGDYDQACAALGEALNNQSELKSKNIPKGYYYYGKALIRQLQQAATQQDNAKLEKYGGNLLKAHEAFKLAKKNDDGKWGDKVDIELNLLFSSFLQGGLQALNSSYSTNSQEQKNELLLAAKQYVGICTEISPDNYMSYDLLGQAELGLADSTNAYKSFSMAGQKFQTNLPSMPDLLIGYVYYRLALIDKYKNNDVDMALSHIEIGKKLVEQEWGRLQSNSSNYTEEQIAALNSQYTTTIDDLSRFELDILLNSPENLDKAITKFEKAIQETPNDYMMHVAYAQLLEKVDRERAVTVYQKATEIDPNNYMAYFNLGVLYNNIATEYYAQANELTDYESAKPLEQKAREYLAKAYPNFQKANIIEPTDAMTVRALMQIAMNLEKMEDYTRYKTALKALEK